jgi:hypothetical protein
MNPQGTLPQPPISPTRQSASLPGLTSPSKQAVDDDNEGPPLEEWLPGLNVGAAVDNSTLLSNLNENGLLYVQDIVRCDIEQLKNIPGCNLGVSNRLKEKAKKEMKIRN